MKVPAGRQWQEEQPELQRGQQVLPAGGRSGKGWRVGAAGRAWGESDQREPHASVSHK